jgi:hypothetical protein
MPTTEPTTAEAVQASTADHMRSADRFGHIASGYESHRSEHGCYGTYPHTAVDLANDRADTQVGP